MQKVDLRKDPVYAQKVLSAAYDYLADGASYRKVAPLYGVSYVTIKAWFDNYLPKIDQFLYSEVRAAAESRREKTIDDPEVRERIAKAVALILKKDMTVKEIADELGTIEWTIYRDLVTRLPKIKDLDEGYYEAVKKALSAHSMENSPFLKAAEELEQQSEVVPTIK